MKTSLFLLAAAGLALSALPAPSSAAPEKDRKKTHKKRYHRPKTDAGHVNQFSKNVNHETNRESKDFNRSMNRGSKDVNHAFQGKKKK